MQCERGVDFILTLVFNIQKEIKTASLTFAPYVRVRGHGLNFRHVSTGRSCPTPLSHKQQEGERQFTDYKRDLEAAWRSAPDTRRWHGDRRAERLERRPAAERGEN